MPSPACLTHKASECAPPRAPAAARPLPVAACWPGWATVGGARVSGVRRGLFRLICANRFDGPSSTISFFWRLLPAVGAGERGTAPCDLVTSARRRSSAGPACWKLPGNDKRRPAFLIIAFCGCDRAFQA
jgi:hypothetical protein